MTFNAPAVLLAATLFLTACSQPLPAGAPAPAGKAALMQASNPTFEDALVADSGQSGNMQARLTISTAVENELGAGDDFGLLALRHRWVQQDIFQYEATIKVFNGIEFLDANPPIMVVIPQKGPEPKTNAVFTNLMLNQLYQVEVVAKGDHGGTAATTTLNADHVFKPTFEFAGDQDVQDTLSIGVPIFLDAVKFSGTVTGAIHFLHDGQFQNTLEPISGSAE